MVQGVGWLLSGPFPLISLFLSLVAQIPYHGFIEFFVGVGVEVSHLGLKPAW